MSKQLFDLALGRRRKARAAKDYRQHRFLAERCALDVVQRLSAVNKAFPMVVNLTSHQSMLADVAGSPKSSLPGCEHYVECDPVSTMLGPNAGDRLLVDDEAVPFAASRVDLFISLLSLHHVNDLPGVLVQLRRALRPDGLLLAAMFGGETLIELRETLTQAEIDVSGGLSPRVSPFVDVRDAGGLLQRAGYALPVVDSDTITVTYKSVRALMQDLRGMGQTNILNDRSKSPLARRVLDRCEMLYRQNHGTAEGKLNATFEILYLTGWCPHDSQQKPMAPGTAKARLADALRTKEEKL